jgi:hypothetical protein
MPATITDEPIGRLLASRTEMRAGLLVGDGLGEGPVVGGGVGVGDTPGVGVGPAPDADGAGVVEGGADGDGDGVGEGDGKCAGRTCSSPASVAWMR